MHTNFSPSRILRSNFKNSAAIFTKFCGSICQILQQYFSTQTSKIYTNSNMIKKFCKIQKFCGGWTLISYDKEGLAKYEAKFGIFSRIMLFRGQKHHFLQDSVHVSKFCAVYPILRKIPLTQNRRILKRLQFKHLTRPAGLMFSCQAS